MATKQQFANTTIDNQIITILAGQTESNILDLGGCQPRALAFPANFTASNVTVQPILRNIEYNLVNFDGSSYTVASIQPFQWLPLVPSMIDVINNIKITTGIAQVSDVQIIVLLSPIYQGVHN